MKPLLHHTVGILLATVVSVVAAKTALAQDPVKLEPNTYKVLLENDRVRVLEVRQKPGEKGLLHSHPAALVYPLSTSKAKFTSPDGKAVEVEIKAGQVVWNEAQAHAVETIGSTDTNMLEIELKK